MNHKLFKLMEEVVLVNKQIIVRFTTVVQNFATLPSDQKFSNQYSIRGY